MNDHSIDPTMLEAVLSNGAMSAEERQARAVRTAWNGHDSRGGLLGRLMGVRPGGAVFEGAEPKGNPGSIAFRRMQQSS